MGSRGVPEVPETRFSLLPSQWLTTGDGAARQPRKDQRATVEQSQPWSRRAFHLMGTQH